MKQLRRRARGFACCAAAVLAALAGACAPALDWRQVRPEGSGAQILMPCRPQVQTRRVALAGVPATLSMSVCDAGGQTWALAYADGIEPARSAAVMAALQQAAQANLRAAEAREQPLAVPGATPGVAHRRVMLRGKLPDGSAAEEQIVLATRGTRVFQATVLGARLPPEAADTFVMSLHLGEGNSAGR